MASARLATIITAGALVVALSGCSSDSATEESAPASVSVEASSIAEEPAEDGVEESAESETAETEASSGTAVLVDGEAPAERTITITSGAMSPATLTVAAGDTVTFVAGDDAVYAVEVGELDSATVSGGLVETFQFPEAGEYEVVEVISGTTAFIVVE